MVIAIFVALIATRESYFKLLGRRADSHSGHKLLFSVTPSPFTVHYVISCNDGLSGHSLFADRSPRLPYVLSPFFYFPRTVHCSTHGLTGVHFFRD